MAETETLAKQYAQTTCNLLGFLGFVINFQKSILVPLKEMEFLGFLIDSRTMTLALPREKIRKVKRVSTPPRFAGSYGARISQGQLTSTIQAVLPAPLHFRHLQEAKNKALDLHHTYEHSIPLTTQAKEELVWWKDNLEAWHGKALVSGSPDLIIETDAYRKGWGAFCMGTSTGGSGPSRNFPAHKLLGASSRSLCSKNFYQRQGPDDCSPADGQYVCSTLYKQNGRYKTPRSGLFSTRSLGLVSTTQDSCGSQVPTRHIEHLSRQRVPSDGGPS